MIGNGVTVWGNQGPKVFETGRFLAIDAYSAIGLGATFKVLRLCIIYFEPVFTSPVVPLLRLILKGLALLIC